VIPQSRILDRRRAGILLHPTSLPGGPGNGDLGPDAYRFVDFLTESGMSIWQTLPLGPTHGDRSPYQCLSVHAGDPLLISLDWLAQRGWLDSTPMPDTGDIAAYLRTQIAQAHRGFVDRASREDLADYQAFLTEHRFWLEDFALYQALRKEQGDRSWVAWPAPLRDRDPAALEEARTRLAPWIERFRFEQFVFFRQWHELRQYANARGILLFGDVPIFVAHDSADVWAHREYFDLYSDGTPRVVAGVPPDYFSATGQRWGNPLYRWERLQADGFRWWVERMRSQLDLFDLVRIDHFRGFEAYWEIPAESATAIEGRWVKAPGRELFDTLRRVFRSLPLVAEDLGIITPEVEALRDDYGLPGMKILEFAFDGSAYNPYLPHNHIKNCVIYTGTHDNDTALGWFASLDERTRSYLLDYLGGPQEPMPWPLIRVVLMSVADFAIIPMQDVLGLGSEHRMNIPGTVEGNWRWRFEWGQVPHDMAARLRRLLQMYGRVK